MSEFTILLIIFLLLYSFSRIFVQKLFAALFLFTKNRELAANFLGLIFLPGTFLHEASHFLAALFTLVPVGDLDLKPEVHENGVKLGSVKIARVDFFRGSIVGIAPFIAGAAIIIWLTNFAFNFNLLTNLWFDALYIFVIFEITHTMFSSKRDLKAVFQLVVFLTIVSGVLIYLKKTFLFDFLFTVIQNYSSVFLKVSYILIIPLILEVIFLFLVRKIKI